MNSSRSARLKHKSSSHNKLNPNEKLLEVDMVIDERDQTLILVGIIIATIFWWLIGSLLIVISSREKSHGKS